MGGPNRRGRRHDVICGAHDHEREYGDANAASTGPVMYQPS
ncbi:hypothetical protein OJ998_15580 [Solirubrobacter taibaiensis]|nr:hypothetical protein [Solirubrobacter taibaiensis]